MKESQKGVHIVSCPLKGLIVSLGSLTLFLSAEVAVGVVPPVAVGVVPPVAVGAAANSAVGGGRGVVAFSIEIRVA